MSKAIKIQDIAIDGGTHENYVIGFSDGTVKVGTTGRGAKTWRYRVRCIAYWKEKYGSDFAEQVEREFAKTRKGK